MRRYFPGKHSINMMVLFRNALSGAAQTQPQGNNTSPSWREHAETFFHVLELSPGELELYDITVVALHSEFISAIRDLALHSESSRISRLNLLDAEFIQDIPGTFYVLDDHPDVVPLFDVTLELD